jgi:nitrate reductase gamma subunit
VKPSPTEQLHHLPDLTSFDEVLNLLFLLNVVILGPLLYRPFYVDRLSITEGMRESWAFGQEQATDILNKISDHYRFHMEGREVNFSFIVYSFLSHQIRCLVRKVKTAETDGDSGISLYNGMMEAIPIAFADSRWLSKFLATHRRFNRSMDKFDWYDKSDYVVSIREMATMRKGMKVQLLPHISMFTRISGHNFQFVFPRTFWVGTKAPSTRDLVRELKHL